MRALKVIFVTSCFLCSFAGLLGLADGQGLSKKARKLAQTNLDDNFSNAIFEQEAEEKSRTTTTENPFADFDLEIESDSSTEDPFFTFEDDPFFDGADILPSCDDEFLMPDDDCTNATVVEPEIRYDDPIFKRLIAQVWADYQYKLNQEGELYGYLMDPLEVDSKLPKPINDSYSGSGYTADVQMHDIKVYGLSKINLATVDVTRSENLTDMRINLVFAFDSLEINGTYALLGSLGWWTLDSKGEQDFSVKMVNATLSYQMDVNYVAPDAWNARRCTPQENVETVEDNVLLENIDIPLRYDDIDFKFDNLGAFANTVVNMIGTYILQTQEAALVGKVRKLIQENINSLIC